MRSSQGNAPSSWRVRRNSSACDSGPGTGPFTRGAPSAKLFAQAMERGSEPRPATETLRRSPPTTSVISTPFRDQILEGRRLETYEYLAARDVWRLDVEVRE